MSDPCRCASWLGAPANADVMWVTKMSLARAKVALPSA